MPHTRWMENLLPQILSHELILDKLWMEHDHMNYHTKFYCMTVQEATVSGLSLKTWEKRHKAAENKS